MTITCVRGFSFHGGACGWVAVQQGKRTGVIISVMAWLVSVGWGNKGTLVAHQWHETPRLELWVDVWVWDDGG